MLEAPDDVRVPLRRPCSGDPLTATADGSLAAGDSHYDVVDGLPVLIDFDRSVIPSTTIFAPRRAAREEPVPGGDRLRVLRIPGQEQAF